MNNREGSHREITSLDPSPLVSRTVHQLSELDLATIHDAGIWRHRDTYFLNITYPSMQVMQEISPTTVYPINEKSTKPRRVGLYIHIPFCTAECYYCHYYKKFGKSEQEVDTYLEAVDQELLLHQKRDEHIEAESVYIGGGTPSYLTEPQIEKLFMTIRHHMAIDPHAEISFEVHPESATPEKLSLLRSLGANRINLGVESFNDDILLSENRRHTTLDAIQAYHRIRAAGFDNVNIDLIYGLMDHTPALWEETLDYLARLQPPSATLYYLRLKRGTPEFQLWKRYPERFPSDEELLLMHAMNFEAMERQLGYIQLPVDWFIRNSNLFHTYQDINWRRSDETELLGIGASSYSYVNGTQYYNINDTDRYINAIQRGELPVWRGEKLDRHESMRRTVMLGIKMGMDRRLFAQTYDIDIYEAFSLLWDKLARLGLITISDNEITLTYAGKLFADEVGQQFYSETMKHRMAEIDPYLVSTTWPQLNS